ncbi:MAG TPA: hypothetical protein VI318_12545 [Baekduia sp.]
MRLLRRSSGLLAIVAALSLAISASASATTVTVAPGGGVTGTGTTHWFLHDGTAVVDCPNAGFTATLSTRTGALPVAISSDVQQIIGPCTVLAVGGNTIACTRTGTMSVTGLTVSGVTQLRLAFISCTITVTGVCSARIDASSTVPASFNNGTGQLTILASGQSIRISGSTCGRLLPDGSATVSGPSGADFVYNVSPRTTISAV